MRLIAEATFQRDINQQHPRTTQQLLALSEPLFAQPLPGREPGAFLEHAGKVTA